VATLPQYFEICSAVCKEARQLTRQLRSGGDRPELRRAVDEAAEELLRQAPAVQAQLLSDLRAPAAMLTTILGRRRMLQFLVIRAIESPQIRQILGTRSGALGPSLREKLSAVAALSTVIIAVAESLGNQDPSAVKVDADAVLDLAVCVATRQYGLEGALDIRGTLRSFARVEPALYLWREAYRDHLLHAADVCLLGWLLLDSKLPGSGETLAMSVAARMGAREDLVYANWFLASLLHDVGYAVDAICQAVGQIRYLRSDSLEQLREQVTRVIDECRATIESTTLQALEGGDSEGLDHGVIGSLHLSDTLTKAIPDPARRSRFQPACAAILKHNLVREPVSFGTEPIAALLILCDELQEWERPRMSGRWLAALSREAMGEAPPEPGPSARILESLELAGLGLTADGFAFAGDALECRLTYRAPELGRFWPQRVCVEKCRNLQRLDLTGLPFRLRMTLVNQYLGSPGATEYGLEALRSYALRRPEAGLIEFVNGRREDVEVLRFGQLAERIETVSFDMEQLNRFPLLPGRSTVDWDDFGRWSLLRPGPYDLEPEPLL